MTDLKAQKELWEKHGASDPLWAVLTVPGLDGRRWKPAAFFATGRKEIAAVRAYLKRLKLKPVPGRALDFGCGAGRLSQALAAHFKRVDGVDISASMLAEAKRHLKKGSRCHFHLNQKADLSLFKARTFDFIYCSIVLQHIPPKLAQNYVAEFMRVLKPGGLACFQAPERRQDGFWRAFRYWLRPKTRLKQLLQALGLAQYAGFDPHPIPMYAHPERRLRPVIEVAGGRVVHLAWNNATELKSWKGLLFSSQAMPGQLFPSRFYVVRKD